RAGGVDGGRRRNVGVVGGDPPLPVARDEDGGAGGRSGDIAVRHPDAVGPHHRAWRDRRHGGGAGASDLVHRMPEPRPASGLQEEEAARDQRSGASHQASLAFQSLYRSRNTFLSNLPTLVLGTASMIWTSSGSAHLATRGRRWSVISVGSSRTPGFGTTHASGRSTHPGCGTAMRAASRTCGVAMIM